MVDSLVRHPKAQFVISNNFSKSSQLLYLVINATDDLCASTAEGKLAEDSLEYLIVGMQASVRAEPDYVLRQLTAVVVDRPKLRDLGFVSFFFRCGSGRLFGGRGCSCVR